MSRRTPSQRGRQRPTTEANNARPRLTLLSEAQKAQVHGYALRILAETGVRVDSPGVLRFLEGKLGAKAEADLKTLGRGESPLPPASLWAHADNRALHDRLVADSAFGSPIRWATRTLQPERLHPPPRTLRRVHGLLSHAEPSVGAPT